MTRTLKIHALKALTLLCILPMLASCGGGETTEQPPAQEEFRWQTDQFEDVRILRYQIPGWDKLSLRQKELAYYLVMSGLAGRDIIYDQNHRHNLAIRRAIEKVVEHHQAGTNGSEWDAFMVYAKRMWFANGIHHHYSNAKFEPGFSREWFVARLAEAGGSLPDEVLDTMFDPSIDALKVNQDPERDLVLGSAVNFYGLDVSEKEVEQFYAALKDPKDPEPISYGLNSKLDRDDRGRLVERTWKVGGMYGQALEQVVFWLEKAMAVAENEQQREAIGLLVEYYRSGDLRTWDAFNIAWVKDTLSDIDFIHGFVEVYNDPMGLRGSYETIIQMRDPEASERMGVLKQYAGWFEQNSPILPEHKREDVVGITYNFINVVGESGDASPSTPVGVNLPNANWIRARHGSKSVSLGNINEAYEKASGPEMLQEFAFDEGERERAKEHGAMASKLHTAMHEVIGHASGRLEPGVDQDALKNYASPLEEARADLVALYYIMDPKLVEIGLMPSLDVGRTQYEGYLRNGLMLQLRRLKLGDDVQQAHMRNRQMVSKWVYERGLKNGAVVRETHDGRTFFRVKDHDALRGLFGELLREVQRIKSQGDYDAAKALFDTYGVKVDQDIHAEVLKRSEKIKTAPYAGFIQPMLEPVTDADGRITDVKVTYPDDFVQQMLDLGKRFSLLPEQN